MNASSCGNKGHPLHPPRNPFRTQQRDDATAIMSNPVVRTCYVVAVGALLIAVSVVAYSTYTRLPSALHNDPHRLNGIAVPSVPVDLKILQPELRSRASSSGGNVNNNNSLRSIPDARLQVGPGVSVPEKQSLPQVRTRDYGRAPEGDNAYQDQEEEEHEDDDVNGEEEDEEGKAPDDLAELRPGDSHAKMLGETKDQVKLEMDQEGAYSDHVFGVALADEEAGAEGSQKKSSDQVAPPEDLVILLPRKSDLDTASGNSTTLGGDLHASGDVVAEN